MAPCLGASTIGGLFHLEKKKKEKKRKKDKDWEESRWIWEEFSCGNMVKYIV